MTCVKDLNVFVIMCGDRGYYSARTGGTAFREDPTTFTLYRNYTNADRFIRREIKSLKSQIKQCKERGYMTHVPGYEERLVEWEAAEVVRVVD